MLNLNFDFWTYRACAPLLTMPRFLVSCNVSTTLLAKLIILEFVLITKVIFSEKNLNNYSRIIIVEQLLCNNGRFISRFTNFFVWMMIEKRVVQQTEF